MPQKIVVDAASHRRFFFNGDSWGRRGGAIPHGASDNLLFSSIAFA